MKCYFFVFLIPLLCYVVNTDAQPVGRSIYALSPDDSLYNDFFYKEENILGERLNMFFPALGIQTTIGHRAFDFDHIARPAVIMIGFADCPPCRVQLPLMISYSNDTAYRGVDFMYITYDDTDYIKKEIGNQRHDNLEIFSVSKNFILGSNMLAATFPTVYFVNGHGVVRRFTHGGGGADADAVRKLRYKWNKYLQLVTAN